MIVDVAKHSTASDWWTAEGGFFGEHYMTGDDSIEGYRPEERESLEARTAREVDGVVRLLGLSAGTRVLDVPCGYGRHSVELARRGYRVVGVDVNDVHLRRAQQAAAWAFENGSGNSAPRLLKGDMRDLLSTLPEAQFDAVINMFFSFGFFGEEENHQTMRSFASVLRRGGHLLLHTDVCPEMILQGHKYRLDETRNMRGGGQLVIHEEFDPRSHRLNGTWTLRHPDREIRMTPYSVRLYSLDELRAMAVESGFREVSFFRGFDGEAFEPNSSEQVMVARI